jgi:hypothetical protein
MSASTIPFWGQAWSLTVEYVSNGATFTEVVSTDAWEPESLRITFEVTQAIISSPFWFADITIYNLGAPDIQNILLGATRVTLSAGFQTGPALSSIIWDGPVFQVTYDQEDVVDQRVTLHCVNSPLVMENIVSFSMGAFSSQQQMLAKMAEQINLPTMSQTQGTLSPYAQQALAAKRYPRGNTVFGKMGQYLDTVANDQNLSTFRDGVQAYMTEVSTGKVVPPPDLIYSPPFPLNQQATAGLPAGTTETIIGTPRQTPQGVIFTVLLDPRLKVRIPVQVVQLTRVLISQLTRQIGGSLGSPLNSNLTFFVGQVRHRGDSRGNDWYTEVTGYSTTYASSLLDGVFSGTS